MKFTIKRNDLASEIGYMGALIEKKSTIPVLSNILIESAGDDKIRLTGTDLDVTLRLEVPAEIEMQGAICVPAHKLFDIVKLLPDADIVFKQDEKNDWAHITCKKSKFKLPGASRDNFPEVPEFKAAPLKLSAKTFVSFINLTSFAITQEQSRFTLSAAKFIAANGTVKMVTTDGHRLAYAEADADIGGEMDQLIPKKALAQLTKIASGQDGEVSFGEDPNHLFFEADHRLLITRKLSGTFPNYEMVFPKANDKNLTFDAEEMKTVVRRVALMSDERMQSMRFDFKPGEILVSANSAEEGEASETIAVDYDGPETAFGVSHKYLTQFLQTVKTDNFPDNRVTMNFKDNTAQVLFHAEDRKLLHVIMPLRL